MIYRSVELFAGAGGLALGVEKAGFSPIMLVEIDKDAAATLKSNRPRWNVINDDISNISRLDLEKILSIKSGELDLISGGAPCQSFRTQVKDLDWKMPEVLCSIITRFFYRNFNLKLFSLKTFADY